MKFIRKFLTAFVITGTLIAIAAIFYIWNYKPGHDLSVGKERGKIPHIKESAKGKTFRHSVSYSHKGTAATPADARQSHKQRGVAIIIDDIGGDLKSLEELLAIHAPITFAVLPHGAHSVEAARLIHKAGRDVLLHLPMEPYEYPQAKPGEGALFVRMDDQEIRNQVDVNIQAIPYICGVNNHMGSLFMENEAKLAVVFERLKNRGLFFVDSRTTPASRAKELAVKMDIPFAERREFIDNDNSYPATFERIIEAIKDAQAGNGEKIVIIGHPYPDTIQALKKAIPLIRSAGVDIIPISELIKTL